MFLQMSPRRTLDKILVFAVALLKGKNIYMDVMPDVNKPLSI